MANIKVLMLPHLTHFRTEESGIKRVVEAYSKYLPQFGVELVHPDAESYDVKAVHAGMTGPDCTVAHLHGLYWSGDNAFTPAWEWEVNARIVQAIRNAKEVTVPSSWVSESFQRDLRYTPRIIGHGIEWEEWQHNHKSLNYVLWNKNRVGDVCSPDDFNGLARQFKTVKFISTFGDGLDLSKTETEGVFNVIQDPGELNNAFKVGIRHHQDMKRLVQQAGVYFSSTKETFGIGVLEALAAGIPVLGVNLGGNRDLIEHGVTGYLYEPGNYDDMAEGLAYCLKHRRTLGENGRELAREYTWEKAVEKVAEVYRLAMVEEPPTVSVIIPVYNKTPEQVRRAIQSCQEQTLKPDEIIVVNDGNPNIDFRSDYSLGLATGLVSKPQIVLINQNNQGVANARNNGISSSSSKYICCLDADDWLEPTFLETCVKALEADRSLGIAYTRLRWHNHETGQTGISDWPGEWDFDRQLKKQNQVPTCCTFRRVMWERLGGYRQRYAPGGAGAEDAEFWLRAGAYGWKGELVTGEALFNYSFGGSVSANKKYVEPDWLSWHPWVKDGQHPFASYATPKRLSHSVRQYDEPIISVVIPVGPGHEREIINALDSLEAQTFRKWEVIVVLDFDLWDKEVNPTIQTTEKAYPYARFYHLGKPHGAGFARNHGAKMARAPFLLFLDADDTLHPQALEKMLSRWNDTGMAVYTDYVGQAFINETYALDLEQKSRLQSFNAQTGEAIISYQAYNFDCERAMRQPQPDDLYIWNLITTLHPKAWFDEIGGFDETMETWEDWDYWLRLARAGHCFTRLPEQLVRYRFHTGSRRSQATPETQEGRHKAQSMIEYLRRKYGNELMGCGCKKNGTNAGISGALTVESNIAMADSEFVKARYLGPGGNHHIIGAFEFNHDPGLPSRKKGDRWVLYYGYKGRGFETLVHKEDVRLMAGKWEPLPDVVRPEVAIAAPPEPKLIRTEPPKPIVAPAEAQERLSKAKERAKAKAAGA